MTSNVKPDIKKLTKKKERRDSGEIAVPSKAEPAPPAQRSHFQLRVLRSLVGGPEISPEVEQPMTTEFG